MSSMLFMTAVTAVPSARAKNCFLLLTAIVRAAGTASYLKRCLGNR